jgi:hypothetical protein
MTRMTPPGHIPALKGYDEHADRQDGADYCFGTGMGRMLETFQPSAVLRRT